MTDTNMLKGSIEDEQLQLEAHLALKPQGDAANEIVTDYGAGDTEDIEGEKDNGPDGKEEGDKSNKGKSLTKSARKYLKRKAREAQLRKGFERL